MRKSQLQTEISIGSTESYCTELIQVSRKIIPIIEILKEMKALGIMLAQFHQMSCVKCFKITAGR